MTSFSNVNFTADNIAQQPQQQKKEIVYVSKNPNATVNATGVVAGTAGMVGGAVLGGTVGVFKLPAEMVASVAGTKYGDVFTRSLSGFKSAVASSPELSSLVDTMKNVKSPEAAEEFITIVKTISERLNTTFAHDADAKAVIDKVINPISKIFCLDNNLIGGGRIAAKWGRNWFTEFLDRKLSLRPKTALKGLTISKFILGFDEIKPTTFARILLPGISEKIAFAADNMAHFTPEEKAAWGRVARQISEELEHNPKVKFSKDLCKALSAMFKDFNWLTEPLKNMQNTIIETAKGLNKNLGNAPIKTIGKWSAIGAAACGTLSTLGWFGLKKGLMTKENEKALKSGQV